MNKFIFLDFDGVFNYIDWWDSDIHYDIVKSLGQIESNFDPDRIELFNYVLSEVPDAKVVLSTSWRFMTSKELAPYGDYPNGIGDVMKRVGLRFDFDCIPNLMPKTRDFEIIEYLTKHINYDRFVIIDDEDWYSDSIHKDVLLPKFVKTEYFGEGFSVENMNECINLLKYG